MEIRLIGSLLQYVFVWRKTAAVTTSDKLSRNVPLRAGLVGLLFLLAITPGMASQVVLDEINIHETETATNIDILFGLPLEYLKHFPQKRGEILQIQLGLEEENNRAIHKEVREGGELLSPEGKSSVLVYVTYEEGVPGGPYLTLRFSHQVEFEVNQGPDRKSLRVKIAKETPKPGAETGVAPTTSKAQSAAVDLMMAKARQAITFGNNKGAINLLRKIIRAPESEHTQQANELLGLALERDKQIPRAKYEYKKYLKRYPEGAGADRVKQRLAALRDTRVVAKRKLRRSKTSRQKDQITTFGRLTQAYSEYYLDRDLDADGELLETQLQQQLLSTHFSVKSRYRSKERTMQAEFTASQTHDFLAKGRREEALANNLVTNSSTYTTDESDVRRMYLDVDDRVYGYTGRLGRQTSRNGGVFGTFDGVIAGYHITPQWQVSAMAGKPIIHTFSNIETSEKSFFGIKADVESTDKKLGSNQFFVQQEVDGILDRQALGGDVRYAQKGLSIFGLLDYDVLYSELSLFNLRIGWNYTESNKLNFSYNRRNLVMTSQALNGMSGIYTIDQLLDYLPESEIRRIAKERTQVYETLTLGNTYQYTKDRQFNADVTVLKSSAIPEGVNPLREEERLAEIALNGSSAIDTTVFGAEASDLQYIYSLQLISSNTFIERDLYVVGLKYSSFDTYNDTSAFINARIPLFEKWRTGMRLNVSKRDSQSAGKSTIISPVIKINYRLTRAWSFDADVGMDFVDNVELPDEVRQRLRLSYAYTF
jgi:hypothetical protein